MKWAKRGLVYVPKGDRWWARTHAYIPTPMLMGDSIRVYFASLDEEKVGRVGYVELDSRNPLRVRYVAPEPVFDVGEAGTFDDNGVSPTSCINCGGELFLYYFGWQLAKRVPHLLFAGLAVSTDGGLSFRRHSRVPILERTHEEPFLRTAPFAMADGDYFRMWYVSGTGWISEVDRIRYRLVLRHAISKDGYSWKSHPGILLEPPEDPDFGLGRPWVIKDGNVYKMWYSIRSLPPRLPYRLGYAESKDGVHWIRKDEEVGITVSSSGWDSEMICFAAVLDVAGHRFMFYNGNRHGMTGFGLAELESE